MAILDLKQKAIEPLAPDKDTVSDAVNPLGGLKTVVQGLDSLQSHFKERLQDHIKAQALTEYTAMESDHSLKHAQFILSQKPNDPEKAYQDIHKYSDELASGREKYISSVKDRDVREYLRRLSRDAQSTMTKSGVLHTIKAMEQQGETLITDYMNHVSKSVYHRSDQNTYNQAVSGLAEVVNHSGMNMAQKELHMRVGMRDLNKVHARGSHNKSPTSFDHDLIVTYENGDGVKDPLSASSIAESAGAVKVEASNSSRRIEGELGIGYNSLSYDDQRLLQKEWATEATSAYAKARPPIAKAIKAYENACLKGEQPNTEIDVTSRAILSKAYNPEDVEKIIAKLEIFKRLQPHMGKVKTGTADDFEDVKAELIKEGMLSYVPTAERERKKSMEALLADPVKWAEKSGLIPDINFEMGKFGQTMSERFTGLKEVEKKYNITVPNILGKAGEKRLLDKIKKGSSHDVVSFLSSEADLLSFDDKEKLRTAVGASEDVSLSVGGRLALRDSDSDREASAFIFTGSKSKEALNLQYKRENNKRSIDQDVSGYLAPIIGGLFNGHESSKYKQASESIVLYLAGKKQLRNNPTEAITKSDVENAVKEVLGGIPFKIGNSTTVPRRGESESEHRNRRHIAITKLEQGGKDRVVNTDWIDTVYLGDGKEALVYQGDFLKDKAGNVKVIDLNSVTAEELSDPDLRRIDSGEEYRNSIMNLLSNKEDPNAVTVSGQRAAWDSGVTFEEKKDAWDAYVKSREK